MGVYDADAVSVRADILAAGQRATLRRTTKGTYDPVAGVFTTDAVTTQEVALLALPASTGAPADGDESFLYQSKVRTRRRKCYLALLTATAWEPRPDDELYFEGRWWTLPGLAALRPDGVTAIFFQFEVQS